MTQPEKRPERFWNVPNSLTMSRLALTFVSILLVEFQYYLGALIVFAIAAATDWFDGYFARLLNQTSVVGRQLDPLIDKVMVAAFYVELVTKPTTGVAAWMVIIIISRELLIQGLRSLLEGQGQAFGAKFAGKAKTFVQCFSIAFCLFCLSFDPPRIWTIVRDILTWTAVVLTIYSGVGYVSAGMRMIKPTETRS